MVEIQCSFYITLTLKGRCLSEPKWVTVESLNVHHPMGHNHYGCNAGTLNYVKVATLVKRPPDTIGQAFRNCQIPLTLYMANI